jgi:methyl-accepting chemotaxis protein
MASSPFALDAPLAVRKPNRRGRISDRLFFHLVRAGLISALPALLLFALFIYFQPFEFDTLSPLGMIATLAVTVAILVGFTFLSSWLSGRKLATLLTNLAQVAIRVGDGDWSQRAPMQGPVEVRTLAYRLNSTAEMMHRMLEAIRAGAAQMKSATDQQIESATQASTRAAGVARSATTISEHATHVATLAESTYSGLEQAQSDFTTYVEHSHEEAKRVNQVEEILALINGLATQTNLLSLNATLEADRAGAAGRGLAAIAEEIRLLAEDSKAKAGDIANVLVQVQSKRAQAAAALEHASSQLGVGLDSLRAVADASALVQATTAEQAAASQQVLHDMSQITYGSHRIAETAQQITDTQLFKHLERRK